MVVHGDWWNARQECLDIQSHLVEFNKVEEFNTVKPHIIGNNPSEDGYRGRDLTTIKATAQIMLCLQFTEFESNHFTGYRFPIAYSVSTVYKATDEK